MRSESQRRRGPVLRASARSEPRGVLAALVSLRGVGLGDLGRALGCRGSDPSNAVVGTDGLGPRAAVGMGDACISPDASCASSMSGRHAARVSARATAWASRISRRPSTSSISSLGTTVSSSRSWVAECNAALTTRSGMFRTTMGPPLEVLGCLDELRAWSDTVRRGRATRDGRAGGPKPARAARR